MGLRCELAIDPFSASTYALDLLLDGVSLGIRQRGGKHKGRGRPRASTAVEDRRMWDGWKASGYRKHADFAKEYGVTEKELKDALERERKRRKPKR